MILSITQFLFPQKTYFQTNFGGIFWGALGICFIQN